MRWLDTPPWPKLDVKRREADVLLLTGPSVGARVAGGATAAFGTAFASFGARFLRLPVPAPFKLIPLAFTAVGAGVAAAGAATALASCSVEARRGVGLTFRWKLPAREERVLTLRPDELEGLEITAHVHRTESETGPDHVSTEYRLVAVTRDGRAFPFETFGTRLQANLRKEALEPLLKA